MDSTTLMAEFAEAYRKSRIETFLRYKMSFSLGLKLPQIDTSAHAFDLGFKIDNLAPDVRKTVFNEACNSLDNNRFRLPFPNCFFLVGYTYKNADLTRILFASQDQTTFTTRFMKFEPGNPSTTWIFTTLMLDLNGSEITYKCFSRDQNEIAAWNSVSDNDPLKRGFCLDFNNIQIANAFLFGEREVVRKQAPISSYAQSVNAGRALGRLKPLGDVIELDLDTPRIAYEQQPNKGTGTKKCPHDRRATNRFNPKTKMRDIPVSSSKVNGGRPKPAIYNVTI